MERLAAFICLIFILLLQFQAQAAEAEETITMENKMIPHEKLQVYVVKLQASESDLNEENAEGQFLYGKFPKNFQWGVATSAHQIEGAWKTDGKVPSIWDNYCHNGHCNNGENADIACESYRLYEKDIAALKELGVKAYRFSLAWTRLLPLGSPEVVSAKGVEYYNKLIDSLLANNIEPWVTLYHWDLPQLYEDKGGWLNKSVVDWFGNYSEFCFQTFGQKVKNWITINVPVTIAVLTYADGVFPPSHKDPVEPYIAGHNLLKAHARAYRTYQKKFLIQQRGKVGIGLDTSHMQPATDAKADIDAAERAFEFYLGWFANPIFGTGDYPEMMARQITEKTLALGPKPLRLPVFTKRERLLIKGSADFFGMNFYSSRLIANDDTVQTENSYSSDWGAKEIENNWTKSAMPGLYDTPWGLRKVLQKIKAKYNNPKIYILENGYGTSDGTINDVERQQYFKGHINEMLKAIALDKVDVRGYFAWSLMDNFEWTFGYSLKFGLYAVDFSSSTKDRTARDSARFYGNLIKDNGFINASTESTNKVEL